MDTKTEQRYEETAKLLRVLGHPMRLAMVETLREKPWCVCELAAHLGLNKSAASKHLSLLKSVGVIEMDREGTRVNCTLVMPCVFDMMRCAYHVDAPTFQDTGEKDPIIVSDNSCTSGCCSPKKKEK